MELELQKEHFDCYRTGAALSETREETAETIVPDYSPDIARIVDVSACLLPHERSVADGKLTVAGTVRLTLLYMAEDTQGLRSMEYTVPFEHALDGRFPDADGATAIEGRVCAVEARLLNPRKIFTRFSVFWKATPYYKSQLTVCGGIAEQEAYAIETLCEQQEVSLIESVGSSDFVFSDELTLPGGREAVHELLCARVKPRLTECRNVGSKVIVKGVACVALLYTSEEGKLCAYAEELPFSQILDGSEMENASVSVALTMTGCEVHTGGEGAADDGRTLSVKLLMNAFVVLRRTESVCCITDLYSTSCALNEQMDAVELWQEPEVSNVQQNVREQLDTGTDVKCVLSADVCFGSVSAQQEGERVMLRAAATVKALYLDDADVPLSLERRIEITADAAAGGDAQANIENVCAGDITANINASGIELRFPAEFTVVSQAVRSCACLTALSAEEESTAVGEMPSLVLRTIDEGQQLWDVAKQYRTTVEEILSANELSDGTDVVIGQMLLIPRKR